MPIATPWALRRMTLTELERRSGPVPSCAFTVTTVGVFSMIASGYAAQALTAVAAERGMLALRQQYKMQGTSLFDT